MAITDKQVETLLAEFMDGMSREGEYAGTIDTQARRAVKRAGLPESLVDRAAKRFVGRI